MDDVTQEQKASLLDAIRSRYPDAQWHEAREQALNFRAKCQCTAESSDDTSACHLWLEIETSSFQDVDFAWTIDSVVEDWANLNLKWASCAECNAMRDPSLNTLCINVRLFEMQANAAPLKGMA